MVNLNLKIARVSFYIKIGYDIIRRVHLPVTTRFTGPFLTCTPQTTIVQPYVVWSDLDTFFKMNTI